MPEDMQPAALLKMPGVFLGVFCDFCQNYFSQEHVWMTDWIAASEWFDEGLFGTTVLALLINISFRLIPFLFVILSKHLKP